MTPARDLLGQFLRREGIQNVQAAKALGVSKSLVGGWLNGSFVPGALFRLKIERWTDGAVRARAWLTAEERRELAALKPYRPQPSAPEVAA